MEQEQVIFEIISYAGEARAFSFQALEAARGGDFTQSAGYVQQAEQSLRSAHNVQTALLAKELEGGTEPTTLLMAHAQDHLMTAMLAHDLIKEMIRQYEWIYTMKQGKADEQK